MNKLQLLNMLQISDSMFPIGAFTLSNGLETLVQQERVVDAGQLEIYCLDYLRILPTNELGAVALACHMAEDEGAILMLDHLMAASRGPYELRMGSKRLCQRMIKVQKKIQKVECLEMYGRLIDCKKADGCHGIAVGLFIHDLHMNLAEAMTIYCYSLLSAMVTNTVKLVPLSQMEGQRVLNRLFQAIDIAVQEAMSVTMEDIGIGGAGFDLCSMEHEILYSRLYIS